MELAAYLTCRERIDQLTRSGPDPTLPACPAWTVRDVVAHLVGLCEDWVDHRLEGYASEGWTAAQVARYDGRTIDQILDRWTEVVEAFELLADDPVMGPPGRWAFGDAVTHEADIRGALGQGRVPDDAVRLSLKGEISRWRETLRDAGAPPLRLSVPGERDWWFGTETPGATSARAPAYEVFRALAGRRSAAQVSSWEWTTDARPYLDAGPPYPFKWAATDLND